MSVIKYVADTAFNATIGMACGVVDAGINVVVATGGVVAPALSVLKAGQRQTNKGWADKARDAKWILPHLYSSVVDVVNPGFIFDNDIKAGVVTSAIATPIFAIA